MAETPSNMLPLGTTAPDFSLLNPLTNKKVNLADLKSEIGLVVMFICNHCPYVIHIRDELFDLAHEYQAKGINFVAINANDANNYPADAPDKMAATAQQYHLKFPYLYDETQAVAKAYQAACTPDFYVFDHALKCVYRGQFDDARPGNQAPVTGESLRQALDALLNNEAIDPNQYPSVGCNIKWKADV